MKKGKTLEITVVCVSFMMAVFLFFQIMQDKPRFGDVLSELKLKRPVKDVLPEEERKRASFDMSIPGVVDLREQKRNIWFNLMEWETEELSKGALDQENSLKFFLMELATAVSDKSNELTYGRKVLKDTIEYFRKPLPSISQLSIRTGYNDYKISERDQRILEIVSAQWSKQIALMIPGDRTVYPMFVGDHAIIVEFFCRQEDGEKVYDVKVINAGGRADFTCKQKKGKDTYPKCIIDANDYSNIRIPSLVYVGARFNKKHFNILGKILGFNFFDPVFRKEDGRLFQDTRWWSGALDRNYLSKVPLPVMDVRRHSRASRGGDRGKEIQKQIDMFYDILRTIVNEANGRLWNNALDEDRLSIRPVVHKAQKGPMCTKKRFSLWMRENYSPALYFSIKLHQAEQALRDLLLIQQEERERMVSNQERFFTSRLIQEAKKVIVKRRKKLAAIVPVEFGPIEDIRPRKEPRREPKKVEPVEVIRPRRDPKKVEPVEVIRPRREPKKVEPVEFIRPRRDPEPRRRMPGRRRPGRRR